MPKSFRKFKKSLCEPATPTPDAWKPMHKPGCTATFKECSLGVGEGEISGTCTMTPQGESARWDVSFGDGWCLDLPSFQVNYCPECGIPLFQAPETDGCE